MAFEHMIRNLRNFHDLVFLFIVQKRHRNFSEITLKFISMALVQNTLRKVFVVLQISINKLNTYSIC
jgi:hypothetical protein